MTGTTIPSTPNRLCSGAPPQVARLKERKHCRTCPQPCCSTPQITIIRKYVLSAVLRVFGVGIGRYWRRCFEFMAQVPHRLGAGVLLGGGPAPLERTEVCFAAQVHILFPHLRQTPFPPAPNTLSTCANHPFHLRRGGSEVVVADERGAKCSQRESGVCGCVRKGCKTFATGIGGAWLRTKR